MLLFKDLNLYKYDEKRLMLIKSINLSYRPWLHDELCLITEYLEKKNIDYFITEGLDLKINIR
ncbi:MAG: hypothetical protein U9Q04_10575 [Campylobacterota bacterium]|nr:hypothetical protein [Campylobacterota bacterium]